MKQGEVSAVVLKIALPKGSLQEATFELLKRAGWDFRVDTRSYEYLERAS